MEVGQAIQGAFKLTFNDKDITAQITPYLIDITYTDKLTGQADELDVTLKDEDGRWQDSWYPDKGAKLTFEYGYSHKKLVSAGSFEIDEIELQGPPETIRIRALAAGLSRQVRTRIGKAYENTTLKDIVNKVAKRIKATVIGSIESISIPKATQYGETEWAFLIRICREYGYEVKLTDNNSKLVVTKLKELAKQTSRKTFTKQDVKGWSYRDKITEVAAKTDVRHHDPDKKKLVKGEAQSGSDKTSSDTRKHRRAAAKTPAQAKAMATAEQERHDQDKTAMSISIMGDETLCAGSVIVLPKASWKRLNGEFMSTEAKHSFNGSGGYSSEHQLKKIKDAA